MVAEHCRWLDQARAGGHDFRITARLGEALMATDARAPNELVRPPYDSCYLAIPHEMGAEFPLEAPDGSRSATGGVVVRQVDDLEQGTSGLLFTAVATPERTLATGLSGGMAELLVDVSPHRPPLDEQRLDDARRDCGLPEAAFPQPLLRLAVNFQLWLNCDGTALRTRDSEFAKLRQEFVRSRRPNLTERRTTLLRQASRTIIHVAGAGLRLPAAPTGVTGRALRHRVAVRGHFKQQRFGPGLRNRRVQWIAPYTKGPTMGQIVRRNYLVRGRGPE